MHIAGTGKHKSAINQQRRGQSANQASRFFISAPSPRQATMHRRVAALLLREITSGAIPEQSPMVACHRPTAGRAWLFAPLGTV